MIEEIAGWGTFSGDADGVGTVATFFNASGIAISSDGAFALVTHSSSLLFSSPLLSSADHGSQLWRDLLTRHWTLERWS
jgi:hypothetical protein